MRNRVARRVSYHVKALATTAVAGTILVAVYHGQDFMTGAVSLVTLGKIMLTYLVVYLLFVYSALTISRVCTSDRREKGE